MSVRVGAITYPNHLTRELCEFVFSTEEHLDSSEHLQLEGKLYVLATLIGRMLKQRCKEEDMAGVLRSVVKMIKDLCPPFLHGIPCDNDALDILKIASIENYKKNGSS